MEITIKLIDKLKFMRKSIFLTSIMLLTIAISSCKTRDNAKTDDKSAVSTVDNSQSSLDWDGTYSGIVPCADCEGIKTQLSLFADNTFRLTTQYLNKSTVQDTITGTFIWSGDGSTVTLQGLDGKDFPVHYKVGENILTQLDLKGNVITGELAQNYVLVKTDKELINKYWKLVEIMGKPVVFENKSNKEPHITFKEEGNTVSGFFGCNGFSGTFQLKQGNRISFSGVISTLKMCIGESMEVEKQFNQVLQTADSYYITDNVLTLNRARMAPLAKFEAVYMQ
jgi:heat shock protein HslJ